MAVPYTFGTATASIPLSQLDSNFATVITLGNTAIQLGNTVTTLNNMTLANVTISSGNVTLTNVTITTANVTTANVVTLIVTGNETVQGNTTVTGTITGAKLIPTGSSVTGNGLYLPAANSVGISTNGTNAVYIDSTQNVGIGAISSGAKLAVTGTISATGGITSNIVAGNGNIKLDGAATGSPFVAFQQSGVDKGLIQYVNATSSLDSTVGGGVTKLTTTGLAVTGTLSATSTANTKVLSVIASSSGDQFYVKPQVANSGVELFSRDSADSAYKPMALYGEKFTFGGNSTLATIDSSGKLLVGTTSAFSGSGISPKVTISNTAGIGLIAIGNADAGLVTQPAANTNYYAGFFLNSSSTGVGNISCTGSLTAYNTTSDYRLKTAISSVTGHGERIDSLKPIDYQWKTDNSQARGFLAHEFKTVYPNSVSGDKDAVDADGKPMYQSMQASTSEVIADLVAELQSLRARVAQLESKP